MRRGIQTHALDLGNFGRLIEHLRAGSGMGGDELDVEVVPDDSDRARVALLDDERTCPASKLIAEQERLVERAGGKLGGPHPPPPRPQPRSRRQSVLEWVLLIVLVLVVAIVLAELERAGAR